MSDRVCSVSEFGGQIEAIITEFERDLDKAERRDVRVAADVAFKQLKSTSPRMTGMYAGNWAKKTKKEGWGQESVVIYENAPSYRLTHLLEKGHGGPAPAPAHPHIADAAEAGFAELERRMHG